MPNCSLYDHQKMSSAAFATSQTSTNGKLQNSGLGWLLYSTACCIGIVQKVPVLLAFACGSSKLAFIAKNQYLPQFISREEAFEGIFWSRQTLYGEYGFIIWLDVETLSN